MPVGLGQLEIINFTSGERPLPQLFEQMRRLSALVLTGFGQVMLQQNALTGLLFVVAIACNSWLMLCAALLGNIAANVGSLLLRSDTDAMAAGMYGFNGTLVGIAVFFYHAPSLVSVALIIVTSVVSAFVMRLFLTSSKVPAYTAPFVLTTWVALLLAHYLQLAPAVSISAPHQAGFLAAVARGIGQVWFQDYWLAGSIFLAGLLVCSRQAAVWAAVGSAVGLVLAHLLGYPEELVAAGLFGFNAVLAAIALAGKYPTSIIRPLAGIVLSVLLTRALQLLGVPSLTAPFVLATWLVILATSFVQARRVEA